MVRQCTMCSNPSSGRCSSCNCSAYCSKECQKADWPIHKILCKQLQNFATPPNVSARRGIYLPVGKVTPEFVWVPTECDPADESEQFDVQTYVGKNAGLECVRVSANVIRSRKREDQIQFFTRGAFLVDGSLPNSTIPGLTKGACEFYPWCGSMFAMKVATLELESCKYLHMDTVDFRDLVDFLRSYSSSIEISDMRLNREHKGPQSPLEDALHREADGAGPWVANRYLHTTDDCTVPGLRMNCAYPGVSINCTRDLFPRRDQKFEVVEVSIYDPIRKPSWTINRISVLIGMPVRVRRINTSWNTGLENLAATFLHLDVDPHSTSWGSVSPCHWQTTPPGSCVVVHNDYKKLSPKQVEVLCSFCQDFLQPLLEEALGNPGKPKSEVLRNLTPSSYALFCSGFESGRRTFDDDTTK